MTIERLVVLDDDENYLDILGGFAKLIGLKYLGCKDYSILNINDLSKSDVLLLDIFMPGKDALDILLELSSIQLSAPLAVMSGAGEDIIESVKATALQLNVNFVGALSKPLRLSSLSTLINEANNNAFSARETVAHINSKKLAQLCDSMPIAHWFENHYVYPVFQPQFDAETGQVVGVECLSRICHPDENNISPFEFISTLERQDKINEYTLLFVEHSLTDIKPLLDHNPNLTCSFNISAHNLDKVFADKLVGTLKSFQVRPEQITLEITESIAIKMTPEALYAISRLKLYGVKLAIDDFGTGYSSISQLVDLPFDEIKIDRSFVHQLNKNPKADAIISATFNLVSSLNFNLVIEGVETPGQLNFLRKKGACVIQGYILSKPLLANDLKRVMEATHILKQHYEKAFLSTL